MVPEGLRSWWLSPLPTALSGGAGTDGTSPGWRGAGLNEQSGLTSAWGGKRWHCVVGIVSLAVLVGGGDHTHMGAQLQQ